MLIANMVHKEKWQLCGCVFAVLLMELSVFCVFVIQGLVGCFIAVGVSRQNLLLDTREKKLF